MFRYIALIGGDAERLRQTQSAEWREVLSAKGLHVFCAGTQYHPLADQRGIVVGNLFRRDGQPVRFDSTETQAILTSGGRRLIESYWGRYVAFLTDPSCVLKDPTGRLPCFRMEHEGASLFFSSLADLRALGLAPLRLDWPYIRQRVASGSGIFGRTGIEGVSEILGGEHIAIIQAQSARTHLWQPHAILESPSAGEAEEVRSTVISCTRAWISEHRNILHRLSGGFDSSLLLGCMTQRPTACVTYFDPESTSDERPWARLAARRAGCHHVELARDPRLSFGNLLQMQPLPYPPQDFAFLELGSLERQIAAQYGATAIITGDGGDAVFGSHSHRYAADDYLRRRGVDSDFIKVAADVAELNNISLWHVLLHAVQSVCFGAKSEEATMLQHARRLTCELPAETAKHPWFASGDLQPSAMAVLAPVATSDLYYDPLFPADQPAPEYVSPLLSQPVVELCLRIPSYVLFENGNDRGLARRAFAAEIPPEILSRQWKDRVQGFTESILLHGRTFARELLLDGVLVKQGLLDARKIETALSGRDARSTVSVGEILDHLVVEAWLRSWITNVS